ncbi:MAG: malonyl-CoA synthase [Mangrovicoccus sp.]|nr:malonyl-CoA synthase [Mangrovicoccus sp.]
MTNPLYDQLFGRHRGSDRVFLHLPGGTSLSYGAFVTLAGRYGAALLEMGLEPGDRLATQTPKSPEALALIAACIQTGVVLLPLNTAYTPAELQYFIENSGARGVICAPQSQDALAPIAATQGAKLMHLGAHGDGSLADLANSCTPLEDVTPRAAEDLAAILYTSGTTGRSKGAMLSQANLLSNAQTLIDFWRFTERDVLLHALPIYHTHGLFVGTNITLLAGGSMIFLPKFDLDAVIAAMPQASTMMGVPTFYTRLLEDTRFTGDLAQHMRLFISGSAPLLAETHERFEARSGHRILERYGMTETNMNTSNPYDGERRAGTVGPALPGVEVKITDPESGAPLPKGEIGMVEVRGPNVFQGYWQMPEKTAEELRKDGFFITGDLGQLDKDDYLTIVGRGKDLIISGGFNIYPKEIELLLDEQPGVLESAVVGAPHPDFGESPVAVLVPEPGAQIDLEQIRAAMAETLARFKQPRRIEILPELPRNTMGKVQKAALRAQYTDSFTQNA